MAVTAGGGGGAPPTVTLRRGSVVAAAVGPHDAAMTDMLRSRDEALRDKDELIAVLSSRLETAMVEQGSAADDFEMPRQGHGFIPWGGGEDGQVSRIDARRRRENCPHTRGRTARVLGQHVAR